MATKEVMSQIKLQIPAGQATPSPPVGPALGQHGVAIMDFCKAYNEQTKDKMGALIPVVITVYVDNTFTFELTTPYRSPCHFASEDSFFFSFYSSFFLYFFLKLNYSFKNDKDNYQGFIKVGKFPFSASGKA